MSLFRLGQIVATPAALAFCNKHSINPSALIARHASGDWGDLTKADNQANQDAIAYGGRIFSSYKVGEEKIWIITEHDFSSTCVLLPADY